LLPCWLALAARWLCQQFAIAGQRWRCRRQHYDGGKDVYVVKKGDTLHSIAADQGVDFRSLVIWNSIENPNHILVGQELRTRPPGVFACRPRGTVVRPIDDDSSVEQRSSEQQWVHREARPKVGKERYSAQTLARALAQAEGSGAGSATRPRRRRQLPR
jgi:LysM repeat protein